MPKLVIIRLRRERKMKFLEIEAEKFTRLDMHKYLLGLGIYPNTVCYQSLVECVWEAVNRNCIVGCISDIYASVAQKINKTPSAVERGLRSGIQKCISENRMEIINEYFGYHVYDKKFTLRNGEIISLLAFKINEELESRE